MSRALTILARAAVRAHLIAMLVVVTCAAFAACTVSDLVEALWLTDASRAPASPPMPAAPTAAPPVTPRTDLSAQLVERNMFCADCTAAPAVAAAGAAPTELPLLLIATSLGRDRVATIYNTSTGAQGAYGVGDRLGTLGTIEEITGTWVQLRNEALGRSERIELLAARTADRPQGIAAGATTAEAPQHDQVTIPGIRKVDDRTFEVERALVQQLIAGATSGKQVKGVRVAAVTKGGKLTGVRVAMARPGSLAAAVGLQQGDVIESIDGVPLTSPDQLLEIMARLNTITRVPVQGRRGGAPLDLSYHLR